MSWACHPAAATRLLAGSSGWQPASTRLALRLSNTRVSKACMPATRPGLGGGAVGAACVDDAPVGVWLGLGVTDAVGLDDVAAGAGGFDPDEVPEHPAIPAIRAALTQTAAQRAPRDISPPGGPAEPQPARSRHVPSWP